MSDFADRLLRGADDLDAIAKESKTKGFTEPLAKLTETANEVGRAWSGSFLGYQSRVYYADLKPVPAGAHFSMQFGARDMFSEDGTRGDWAEYSFDSLRDLIFSHAGVTSLDKPEKLAERATEAFEQAKDEFLSVITAAGKDGDSFLSTLKSKVDKMRISTMRHIAQAMHPTGKFITYDQRAVSEGFHTPPHLCILAQIAAVKNAPERCAELGKIFRKAASHLQVRTLQGREKPIGTNICLGHGRSPLWKDLKDFLQDRLELPWDEFNRVPVAGITNIARLSEMLDNAGIAFLVMTAEDEQGDGKVRARENVVHEAGLFQGRLGFTKAIVLLEEGCEEFSNIHGLGQIRFPTGNIKAAFEEVRLVLEREGFLE